MVNFHIIIPARYTSTRLAHKLLKPLANKPLLQYTYEHALEAGATSVTIATDHEAIAEVMRACGAKVLMTKNTHETGTDRLAEAVDLLELTDDAIVVNLQGDEPLLPPQLLVQAAQNLAQRPEVSIATLCERTQDLADIFNPSVIKVVFDAQGLALYFSRAPIPWDRDKFNVGQKEGSVEGAFFRHLGVYAYRAKFLRAYSTLSVAPMEQLEKLEQLRALYHGYKIHLDIAEAHCPPGVDTQEDFDRTLAAVVVTEVAL